MNLTMLTTKRIAVIFLVAGLAAPLATLLGPCNAWCDAGDDAYAALERGKHTHALELAKPAAREGNYMAQFTLGRIYEARFYGWDGGKKGTPQDKATAKTWFKKALTQARPAAEKGDPRAQYVLGLIVGSDRVLPKDAAQALALFRKAAEHGYSPAQSLLGSFYQNGQGVAKDVDKAAAWYRKAADQGYIPAQKSLGSMYFKGEGVDKDVDAAVAWWRKAADQGDTESQEILKTYEKLSPRGRQQIGRKYSRDEFKKRVMGKTPEQVIESVGKPDQTQDLGVATWYYDNASYDPITDKVDNTAGVVFRGGFVADVAFY